MFNKDHKESHMPLISLYIDQDTLEKVEKLARSKHISISKWVGNNIKTHIKNQYPDDFFSLFGAIKDDSFQAPHSLDPDNDTQREIL